MNLCGRRVPEQRRANEEREENEDLNFHRKANSQVVYIYRMHVKCFKDLYTDICNVMLRYTS